MATDVRAVVAPVKGQPVEVTTVRVPDPGKLRWAEESGATHTVDASNEDAVEAIRAATGGSGADVVVEAAFERMDRGDVLPSVVAEVGARIDHTTTSGTFSLDGQTFEVDNNVWVVGDDRECVVIDAPHDAEVIARLVAGRTVLAILATHAHDDHVRVAPELADVLGAPVFLHPDDLVLWRMTHPDRTPERELAEGQVVGVAGAGLQVMHTPGHAPGAVCLYSPELGAVFTGDTLFAGGPGATGRSYSDFGVIIDSIGRRLLTLPEDTAVHPGHGESSTIGAEKPHLDEWIRRGR